MPGGGWVEKRRIVAVNYQDLARPIDLEELSNRDGIAGPFERAGRVNLTS